MSECTKIQPPSQGSYLGAFTPDPDYGNEDRITASSLKNFERKSGAKLDIALKFLQFSYGLSFPTQEAKAVSRNGGAIFIKLESFNPQLPKKDTYSLQDIIDGKYDHLLKRFARGAKSFGKPVFVSFDHEMNGNWYPWAEKPELYKKAYRHVHQVISKIADNITWVWNPDIFSSTLEYYPGGKDYDCVDWVALDGYNWDGTAPAATLFQRRLEELKTLNKPIMIGEYGCAKNNAACLTDFVKFISLTREIKASIYFDKDKEEKWGINTREEKAAYAQAVKEQEALFRSEITSQQVPCPVLSELPEEVRPAAPQKGFNDLAPQDLFRNNYRELPSESKLQLNRNKRAAEIEKQRKGRDNKRTNKEQELSESLISKWLLLQEMGSKDLAPLQEVFGYGYSLKTFWKALLGMIMIQNPDLAKKYLHRLGLGAGVQINNGISKVERYNLLQEIYQNFLARNGDYRLTAENLTKRALLAWSLDRKSDFSNLRAEAQRLIDFYKNPANKNRIISQIRGRMEGASVPLINKEYDYGLGKVRLLEAKLIMTETEEDSAALKRAFNLLEEASRNLKGLENLETKLLALEILIRQGFIQANQGKDYQAEFDKAKEFIAYIQNWEKSYYSDRNFKGTPPRWLKQMAAQTLLWQAEVQMFEAGQIKKETTKETGRLQKNALEGAATTLKEIFKLDQYLETEYLAGVKRMLAENLARQAFVLLGEGNDAYQGLFTQALQYAREAMKEGNQFTQARAKLWIAKILVVQAGKKQSKAAAMELIKKNALKTGAQDYIEAAIASGKLKKSLLSSAYQTLADILLAQKHFPKAEENYRKAIKENPRNFDALVSLGDVLSWRRQYDDAITEYQKVPEGETAHLAARLGSLEAHMRQNSNYEMIRKNDASITLLKQIFEGELPGSPLIPRAISLIIESTLAQKHTQDQVIHIAKEILKTPYQAKNGTDQVTELIKQNCVNGNIVPDLFDDRFKSNLFVALAKVLTWRKRFTEAKEALQSGKSKYTSAIQGDLELDITYQLTEATIKMRSSKEETPEIYAAAKRVFKETPEEPNLLEEALKVLVEEFTFEKRLDKTILLADYILHPEAERIYSAGKAEAELKNFFKDDRLAGLGQTFAEIKSTLNKLTPKQLKEAFFKRGQDKAWQAFKFDLLIHLIEALTWTEKYEEAKKISEKVLAQESSPDSYLATASAPEKAALFIKLGDIYRYGKGLENYDTSKRYYEKALQTLGKIKEEKKSKEHYRFYGEAYRGLAELEQQKGNKRAALINFDKAKEYALLAEDDELVDEIKRGQVFIEDYILKLKSETFVGAGGEIENSHRLELQYPFLHGIFVPQISYHLDTAKNLNIHSWYAGAKVRTLAAVDGHDLDLEATYKPFEIDDYQDSLAAMKYYRQPDLSFSLFYSNKYFNIGGSAGLHFNEWDYNSYYGTFMAQLTSVWQLGLEYNHYLFTYTGEQQPRDDYSLTNRFNINLGQLGYSDYKTMTLRASLAYPYMQYEGWFFEDLASKDLGNEDMSKSEIMSQRLKGNPFTNVKVGLGADIHIDKGFILSLDCNYQHQQDYDYGTCSISIRR